MNQSGDEDDEFLDNEYYEEDEYEENDEVDLEEEKGGRKRRKTDSKNAFVITEAEENDEEEEDNDMGYEDIEEDFLQTTEVLGAEEEPFPSRAELYHSHADNLDDVESTVNYIKQRYVSQRREHLQESKGMGALQDDVVSQSLVPSKSGPMLWVVRCKIGKERELALSLMGKYLFSLGTKNPMLIFSVIVQDHLKGVIYVEAQRESHVVAAIAELPFLLAKKMQLVPLEEMPIVLKGPKREGLKVGAWVRIKAGLYRGDLAQVYETDGYVGADGMGKVTVRLVPRIDVQASINKCLGKEDINIDSSLSTDSSHGKAVGKGPRKRHRKNLRPHPHLFNPMEVHDVIPETLHEERDADGKVWHFWDRRQFCDGFLYKIIDRKFLQLNVEPTIEEQRFALCDTFSNLNARSETNEGSLAKANGIQDDMVQPVVSQVNAIPLSKGDVVKVICGELISIVGTVLFTDGDKVTISPRDKHLAGTQPLAIPRSHLSKHFASGDRVKVLSGRYAGATGLVTQVDNEIATIFDDATQENFKVRTSDLQQTLETNVGVLRLGHYALHDLVQLADEHTVGVIVCVHTDSFDILDMTGQIRLVPLAEVALKRNVHHSTYHDANQQPTSLGDKVRVCGGPHRNKHGTVLHMFRGVAWLNCREVRENSGIIAVRCSNMALVGTRVERTNPVAEGSMSMMRRDMYNFGGYRSVGSVVYGRRHENANRQVRIIRGQWKGYTGIVRNETDTVLRIELDTAGRIVSLPPSSVQLASQKTTRESYRDRMLNATSFHTIEQGSETGPNSTMAEMQTPMRLSTPRHVSTSNRDHSTTFPNAIDPWSPMMVPQTPSRPSVLDEPREQIVPCTPGQGMGNAQDLYAMTRPSSINVSNPGRATSGRNLPSDNHLNATLMPAFASNGNVQTPMSTIPMTPGSGLLMSTTTMGPLWTPTPSMHLTSTSLGGSNHPNVTNGLLAPTTPSCGDALSLDSNYLNSSASYIPSNMGAKIVNTNNNQDGKQSNLDATTPGHDRLNASPHPPEATPKIKEINDKGLSNQWLTPDIEVRIIEEGPYRDMRVIVRQINCLDREFGPDHCQVQLMDQNTLITIANSSLVPTCPAKRNRVKIISGQYKGEVGMCLGIDNDDGIVKMPDLEISVLPLSRLAIYHGKD